MAKTLDHTQRGMVLDAFARAQDYYESWDTDPRLHSYSGRGMYDRYCLAITGDNRFVTLFLVALAEIEKEVEEYAEVELAYDLAKNLCADSLGLGTVFYFPSYALDSYPGND